MLLVAGLLVSPHHPLLLILIAVAGALVSVQDSHGLKLSHLGLQELVVFLWTVELVLIPYWALTGGATALLVAEGALLAFWLIMVSSCSNLRDVATGRDAGRT